MKPYTMKARTYFGDGETVPAFSIAECETDPPSWAVNLSEFKLGEDGAKIEMQVFHDYDKAVRFAEESKRKLWQ